MSGGRPNADTTDRATRLIGVEQHGIRDTLLGAGNTAAAPAAGSTIASVAIPAGEGGVYRVDIRTRTLGGSDQSNTALQVNGVTRGAPLPATTTEVACGVTIERITLAAGDVVRLANVNAGGAGVTYYGTLTLTRIA